MDSKNTAETGITRRRFLAGLASTACAMSLVSSCGGESEVTIGVKPVITSVYSPTTDNISRFQIQLMEPGYDDEGVPQIFLDEENNLSERGSNGNSRDLSPDVNEEQGIMCFSRLDVPGAYGSQNPHHLVISDLDGTNQLRISNNQNTFFNPAISPDGSTISAVKFRPYPSKIALFDLNNPNSDKYVGTVPLGDWFPNIGGATFGDNQTIYVNAIRYQVLGSNSLQTGRGKLESMAMDLSQIAIPEEDVSERKSLIIMDQRMSTLESVQIKYGILRIDLNNGSIEPLQNTEDVEANSQIKYSNGKIWYGTSSPHNIACVDENGKKEVFNSRHVDINPNPDENLVYFNGGDWIVYKPIQVYVPSVGRSFRLTYDPLIDDESVEHNREHSRPNPVGEPVPLTFRL